jgi:hypothetical protein
MTNYQNDTPQSERRAVLKSDRDAKASTYLDHAIANADAGLGGRWAKPAPTQVICGAAYPRQSPNSPWSHGHAVPAEEPLGFAIDAMEPVGEPHEVERSIERSSAAGSPSAADGDSTVTPHTVVAPGGPAPGVEVLGPAGAGLSASAKPAKPAKRALAAERQTDFQLETERRA